VHRTIVYRLLNILIQFRFIAKGDDGRYRPSTDMALLGTSFDGIRRTSLPMLRSLADQLEATVSLLVADGDQQVAITVIAPTQTDNRLSFQEGSRHPLNRGAAGIALLASMQPRAGERELVPQTRQRGWVMTHGEIEPATYGLAVPVHRPSSAVPTCINLISHCQDVVMGGKDAVINAANELSAILDSGVPPKGLAR
jgi:DNA-binding IclR family transcriptional regulator